MKIAGKELRPGRDAFIVAEIGINHGGSVARAIEIVDQLHASGAPFDAVKLQHYRADRLCSSAVSAETRSLLESCQLRADGVEWILAHAKRMGYAGIVTVFNTEDYADLLNSPHVDAWKIASPDAVHEDLIRKVAHARQPIIVSTGTCNEAEVDNLAALLNECAWSRHVMLECVSAYPAEVTFGTITWMALKYPSAVIGYSDHTTRIDGGEMAAGSGARLIEKHVMHADGVGADAAVSFTPEDFATYCRWVRDKAFLVGRPKRFQPDEMGVGIDGRQSVVLRRPVRAGERIARDNIAFKRPGSGIAAALWRDALGTVAVRDIPADRPVKWDDLERG